MNKIANVVFIILGIVSLAGALFLMVGISWFDSQVQEVLSQTESIPLDPMGIQALAQQVKGIITLGYTWSIVVLISSIGLILYAISDLRRQRSLVGRKR